MEDFDGLLEAIEDDDADANSGVAAHQTFGPFAMLNDGLHANIPGGKQGAVKTVFVSGPFEVVGLCRDPEGGGWGKVLRIHDDDGRTHLPIVTDRMLQGLPKEVAGQLASEGLRVNRRHQTQLVEYLNLVQPPDRVTLVDRTGWHEIDGVSVFVHPAETFGAKALGELVMLDSLRSTLYAAKGDLADWQAGVAALAKGQPWVILAISAALAGPLAHLVGAEGGGLHFHGPSSTGKSTLLAAGASVWGRGGAPGYIRSWRATANGLEGLAAAANDTLMVLDEIGVANAREVAAVAYTLANGSAKQRARRDGSAQRPLDFRTIVISSGEITIETKLAEDQGRRQPAGQAVRLVDVRADRGEGHGVFDGEGGFADAGKLADAIKSASVTAYGTAGLAFIHRITVEGLGLVAHKAGKRINKFVQDEVPAGAGEQVARVAKKLGLIAVAGEIAILAGIVPWAIGDAWAAAAEALAGWIKARGGTGSHEDAQAVAQVRHIVELHGEARFEPVMRRAAGMSNITSHPIPNRLGWKTGEGKSQRWFVSPEAWKTEVCRGLDAVAVARALARRGMLLPSKSGRDLSRVVKIAGRPTRVYVVTAAILA